MQRKQCNASVPGTPARTFELTRLLSAVQNQSASPFLKLPPEIRNQIFQLVLGGKLIHTFGEGRFHSICPHHESESEACEQYLRTGKDQEYITRHRMCLSSKLGDGRLLNLSLVYTCKQTYFEARHLVYSLNAFFFHDSKSLRFFASSLHPRQLRAISSLHLSIEVVFRLDAEEWQRPLTSAFVKSFKGLEHLRIFINVGFVRLKDHVLLQAESLETYFFAPLLRFQRLPLKTATVVFSDEAAFRVWGDQGFLSYGNAFAEEFGFRWTAETKKECAKRIEDRLLAPWDEDAASYERAKFIVMRRARWKLWDGGFGA